MAAKLVDKLMAERIPMPGFPQIVVTRSWCYRWLRDCGWSPGERGYDSLDYAVFGKDAISEPLTDESERDRLLELVKYYYLRTED